MAYGKVLTDVVQSSTAGTPVQFNDGNGTQVGTLCRAWVCYQANTQTIRASFNVTSVTYTNTGRFVINLTNALPDTNYVMALCISAPSSSSSDYQEDSGVSRTTTSFGIAALVAGTYTNPGNVSVSVFR